MATAKKAPKLETVKVVVSKAIYDRATKKLKSNSYYVLRDCLIAQAVRSAFPGKTISVGGEDAEVGKGNSQRKFAIDKKGQYLMDKFDNGKVERKKLPITITLTEVPEPPDQRDTMV